MQIQTLSVGPIGTLCYLISAEGAETCAVIDPGAEAARIRKAAGGRRIEAIRLQRQIREVDKGAFITITTSSEIIGRGFRGV